MLDMAHEVACEGACACGEQEKCGYIYQYLLLVNDKRACALLLNFE